MAQKPTHPLVERQDVIIVEGVIKAQHWNAVGCTLEFIQRRRADPCTRGIRSNEPRVVCFQLDQFLHHAVISRIGNFRIVQNVIAVVVVVQLCAQRLDFPGYFWGCSLWHRIFTR